MSRALRRVAVLGSTGSIGQSACSVARDLPDRVQIVSLAAGRNAGALAKQAAEFRPHIAALADETCGGVLRGALPEDVRFAVGDSGLVEAATLPEADIVLVAIVGTAGLLPALAAIEAGKDLAVASKEILVMAGGLVMEAAARKGVRVLPVDSEHNAIFQCLEGRPNRDVRKLILTASGGPFRTTPESELAYVTPVEALRHPTWSMGRKITVDSATLFNKGLEMIEARWLFDVPMDRVGAVVHPQSIVHSMVEFVDGSLLAQLSHSDMRFPIQYALTWPERIANSLPPLDMAALGRLEFELPRSGVFPALRLSREAGLTGGTMPAVLNAANEVAVEAFLAGKIGFPGIWAVVESTMNTHESVLNPDLGGILDADRKARRIAQEAVLRTAASCPPRA